MSRPSDSRTLGYLVRCAEKLLDQQGLHTPHWPDEPEDEPPAQGERGRYLLALQAWASGQGPFPGQPPCAHARVFEFGGKTSDACFWVRDGERQEDGYVPTIDGIGGGDYLELKVCRDCHQLLGVDWDAIEKLRSRS